MADEDRRPATVLIVNADDFGMSPGITSGIVQAHENGIVTSASLMVRWPAARTAVELWRRYPRLGLGLHLDLGEWFLEDGKWQPLYEVVPADDAAAVRTEVERQIDEFRRLTGGEPSHLDSHQHVHRSEPVRSAVLEIAARMDIAVRHMRNAPRYCGDFYGQWNTGEVDTEAISAASLCNVIRGLTPGITELACHPGMLDADPPRTMYLAEREIELRSLCDPEVRRTIDETGVRLASFRDLPRTA